MATSSYGKALLGGLSTELKRHFDRFSEYIFDHNLEFGPVDHQAITANFKGVYLRSTTSDVSSREFSVVHGLQRTPNVFFQVADPLSVNSQTGLLLKVPRAADDKRVYLSCADTSVPFVIYVESLALIAIPFALSFFFCAQTAT